MGYDLFFFGNFFFFIRKSLKNLKFKLSFSKFSCCIISNLSKLLIESSVNYFPLKKKQIMKKFNNLKDKKKTSFSNLMSLIQFFLNKFLIIENFDQKDMYPFQKKLILIFPNFLIFLKLALIN